MGIIFSSLASCFMFIGEFTSYICLGIGQVGSILVRGIFGLIVGICDVLAACMCCWQVPFSDRPDRDGYTYTTLSVNNAEICNNASMVNLPKTTPKFTRKTDSVEEKTSSDEEETMLEKTKISSHHEKQAKAIIKAALAQEKRANKLTKKQAKKGSKTSALADVKEAEIETSSTKGWFGDYFTAKEATLPIVTEEKQA